MEVCSLLPTSPYSPGNRFPTVSGRFVSIFSDFTVVPDDIALSGPDLLASAECPRLHARCRHRQGPLRPRAEHSRTSGPGSLHPWMGAAAASRRRRQPPRALPRRRRPVRFPLLGGALGLGLLGHRRVYWESAEEPPRRTPWWGHHSDRQGTRRPPLVPPSRRPPGLCKAGSPAEVSRSSLSRGEKETLGAALPTAALHLGPRSPGPGGTPAPQLCTVPPAKSRSPESPGRAVPHCERGTPGGA